MFDGFTRTQIATSGTTITWSTAAAASGAAAARIPAEHVMWHKVAPRLAERFHRGRPRSTRLRRQRQAALRRRARGLLQAHDGPGPGRGDGLARLRLVPRRRPRQGRQGRASYGTGPPRARQDIHVAGRRPLAGGLREHGCVPVLRLVPLAPDAPAVSPARDDDRQQRKDLLGLPAGALGSVEGAITREAYAEYLRCFSNPETIRATCMDYRSVELDLVHDEADRGRKLTCPVLALWAGNMAKRRGLADGRKPPDARRLAQEGRERPGSGHRLRSLPSRRGPRRGDAELLAFLSAH